jgi:AcrR family transcriptional regulator
LEQFVIQKRGPYSSPRQQERRQRILRAAALQVEEHGLAALSMQSIAEISEVSTKTLYNQFGSLDLMVLEYASQHLADLGASSAVVDSEEGIPRLLMFIIGSMKQFEERPVSARAVISILVRADLDTEAAYERFGPVQRLAYASLCVAEDQGELRAGLDLNELSYLLAANLWGVVLLWEKGLLKLEQLVPQISLSSYLSLTPLCLGERKQSMEAELNALLLQLTPATLSHTKVTEHQTNQG